jgi:histidinol-phosphatase
MLDAADVETVSVWLPGGVSSRPKEDGTPVTVADTAAETAMLAVLLNQHCGDGFVGEEIGELIGTTGRRWIADGIDGTRFFATGATTWGTLLALEIDGAIMLGAISSPLQDRRWWAVRDEGAFRSTLDGAGAVRLAVSDAPQVRTERVACLPRFEALSQSRQAAIVALAGGRPADVAWSHQLRVAEGELDACVWFAGDVWDHAAPSIIVEEAGGQFSDHSGGKRLDTRTAIYSNCSHHDTIIDALKETARST